MMRRPIQLLGVILLAFSFYGCPHLIEEQIEEAIPPKGYKPIYMTSTVPFSVMLDSARRQGIGVGTSGGPGWDTSGSTGNSSTGMTGTTGNASTGSAAPSLLKMEIRTVDDSRYPNEVELRAFVYDTTGRFVMGLAPPHFAGAGNYRNYWRTLVDSCSGRAVPIDSFTVTEVREDKREPYSIGFVLDHSGSMGEKRVQKLRAAVANTLRVIKRGDQVSVITFTDKILTELPLTGDPAVFRKAIYPDIAWAGGGTALYDGAIAGIEEVSKAPSQYRRAIILFTDGEDGNSDSTMQAVHRIARKNNVTVYTIAYGAANETVLSNIATYTGGRFYRIYSDKEYPFVFVDIYRRMNNYYKITYRPPACDGIHTAIASLSIPELRSIGLIDTGIYDRSLFTPFDPVGQVALVNIEFDYDKATIRPESMPRVAEVAEALNSYPSMKLEIRGHTDAQGGDDYNLKLSKQRAQAVAEALIEMGISRTRLRVEGFGETKPLAPNDTEENRKKNRRTEFVIIAR